MRRLGSLIVFVTMLVSTTAGAWSQAAYRRPVVRRGFAFPLARSDWYSVINFRNDWHAPRMRLVGGRWKQIGVHEGTDVFAEPGTPVLAVTGGRVEQVGWLFYSGWRVGVRAPDGRYWFYAHLSRYAPSARVGSEVEAGDVLGYVGNTGYGDPGHEDEFTYHLHLGIQEPDGSWTNPYPLVRRLYAEATKADR
jgi:murein DD-endopeptidase MepM/ murein hydrolase activator NlpD